MAEAANKQNMDAFSYINNMTELIKLKLIERVYEFDNKKISLEDMIYQAINKYNKTYSDISIINKRLQTEEDRFEKIEMENNKKILENLMLELKDNLLTYLDNLIEFVKGAYYNKYAHYKSCTAIGIIDKYIKQIEKSLVRKRKEVIECYKNNKKINEELNLYKNLTYTKNYAQKVYFKCIIEQ